MGIGTFSYRSVQAAPAAFRCPAPRRMQGYGLVEMLCVLGIMGVLGGLGVASLDWRGFALTSAAQDLRGGLHQAFSLARASGRNVRVAIGSPAAQDVIPVHLPRKVKWGSLPQVPLPAGMDEPRGADRTGEAHPQITVTPRMTATASAWFLNNGQDVICLRLNGQGRSHMLHWSASTRRWRRV